MPNVMDSQRRVYVKASWGAPIIWDSTQAMQQQDCRRAYLTLVSSSHFLGPSYATFLQRMITSVDKYFMIGQNVTYFFVH